MLPSGIELILRFQSPVTWVVAVFGLLLGSFYNVCIFRIPEKSFFSKARSVCRHCGALIPWYRNIPVFSYLSLRGKSACCKTPISIQYPVVEILTALLFVTLYWRFPFFISYPGHVSIEPSNLTRFTYLAFFSSILLICSVIDFRHMIIPDVLSLPMIALTPLAVWIHPDLTWTSAALGVLLGGGVLYGIAWAYWLVRREVGMGMGDVKLLAGIGGWLGVQAIIPTIFYGSLLGSFYGIIVVLLSRKFHLKSQIPFGPFLAVGAIIHILFGSELSQALFRW